MERDQIFLRQSADAMVLRLVGDLRHVSGASAATSMQLDDFLHRLLEEAPEQKVVIDLREVTAMDSTHLGLLASLAAGRQQSGQRPIVVAPRPKITRLLQTMGLDTLFEMVLEAPEALSGQEEETVLKARPSAAREGAEVVLRAHQALAAINEANRQQFQDVIALLESELKHGQT